VLIVHMLAPIHVIRVLVVSSQAGLIEIYVSTMLFEYVQAQLRMLKIIESRWSGMCTSPIGGTVNVKKFASSSGTIWKYVFEFEGAIAEAVLYRYNKFEERTVICCSVQSGCPVGCTFCGTGKSFIRNLTCDEIVSQINHIIYDNQLNIKETKKFQIMFMSMGEPMLNWPVVGAAIITFRSMYPQHVDLLVSTVGIRDEEVWGKLVELSKEIPTLGLQFSIHQAYEVERDRLIPYENKYSLREIRDKAIEWHMVTGRRVYLNYCVSKTNSDLFTMERLKDIFPKDICHFTFSVICEKDKGVCSTHNIERVNGIIEDFQEEGYEVSLFNPDGQDDIGAGCGQLWYVQDYLENKV